MMRRNIWSKIASARFDEWVQLGEEGDCPHYVAGGDGEDKGAAPDAVMVLACSPSTKRELKKAEKGEHTSDSRPLAQRTMPQGTSGRRWRGQ